MGQLHIGKQVEEVLNKKGFTVAEFARRINKSRENVYSIFKRKTMDTGLLQTISSVLEYDFFLLYSGKSNSDEEIDRLKEEIRLLRELNSLLKEKAKKKKM